jgi:ubiquinone/menaquinone biosynthesis C-methylase UbiE
MKAVERQGLRLLPPEALTKTGEVDHADWNYRWLLGTISRTRFRLVVSLLEAQERRGRLLEVGYGSGVFMPELARFADELYGIDIHQMTGPVAASLERFDVNARLFSGSVEALPFDENFFDCVVAVSALEFVSDTAAACREIKRVLRPEGTLVVVTPGHSPLVDFGLKILTGKSAKRDYDDRREKLMPTLLHHFAVERQLTSPAVGNSLVKLYTALRLRARVEA